MSFSIIRKSNLSKINFSEDLDSLQMLDFIEKIEKVFKLKIHQKDLIYKNFTSFKAIEKIIKKSDKYKK